MAIGNVSATVPMALATETSMAPDRLNVILIFPDTVRPSRWMDPVVNAGARMAVDRLDATREQGGAW